MRVEFYFISDCICSCLFSSVHSASLLILTLSSLWMKPKKGKQFIFNQCLHTCCCGQRMWGKNECEQVKKCLPLPRCTSSWLVGAAHFYCERHRCLLLVSQQRPGENKSKDKDTQEVFRKTSEEWAALLRLNINHTALKSSKPLRAIEIHYAFHF